MRLAVANALLKHVYLIYGACELQVHDNGSEFVNSILQHLSRMMGIQDLRSTAYRPVANAAIERTHRTINAVFAKTIKEHQRDWHEQAKYVCFAYNTAKHSSTTFSPFYLVFLREPRVGIDLFLDKSEPAYQDSDEYAETVREKMQKAYSIVGDQLKATFDRAKRRYDQRIREVRFKLNSYVWFYCPKLHAGRGRKFRKLTDGPYRIIRVLNDVNYVIQKNPGSRPQVCHVDRLLKYEGETPKVWLKYDAEQAKVPKESIPANGIQANGIQAETRNQTNRIVVMDSEERDSSVPSTGLITEEERSDMRSKQTKIFIRDTPFRLRPQSKMKVRSNENQRSDRKNPLHEKCSYWIILTRTDSAGRMLPRVQSLNKNLTVIIEALKIIKPAFFLVNMLVVM